MSATLAIIIPTYGRGNPLRRTLRSIVAQTVLPDETIVVDQNDEPILDPVLSDSSLRSLRRLRLVHPNLASSRNAGFLACRSSHVLFLDDDEELAPDFVERLLQTFTRHPEVGCIWPIVHTGDRDYWVSRTRRRAAGPPIPGTAIFPLRRTGGGGTAFERHFFVRSGGYDELLFDYARMSEDWDLSVRMRRKGMAMWCDPSLTIAHDTSCEGGCETRTLPVEEARTRLARACMYLFRSGAGPQFRLGPRALLTALGFIFLSSLGRSDGRRSVLRHPLWHFGLLFRIARESRAAVESHGELYADPMAVDFLSAPTRLREEREPEREPSVAVRV